MILEPHFLDFTNNLLEGNKENCRKIVDELLNNNVSLADIYVDLFQRSMYMIGKMWETEKLTIAEEHIGTAIIEGLLCHCSDKFKSVSENGKTALITCVDKEFHKVGARMASDIFEINGWRTFFMGASSPTNEILRSIEKKKPDIVGLSFNFYMNLMRFFRVVDEIRHKFPDQKIIVGGQGIKHEKKNALEKYPDIFFFEDIKQLDKYLKDHSS